MTAAPTSPRQRPAPPKGPRSAWTDNIQVRRAFLCLIGFTVLDVMTGPAGSNSAPLSGITASLSDVARDFVFLVMAALVWGAMTVHRRYGAVVKDWSDRVSGLPRSLLPDRRVRYGFYLALLLVAVLLPPHVNDFWKNVLVEQVGIYVLLALGLNVVVGYAGLLDLGYIAFYAIGAYSTAFWSGSLPLHPPMHLNDFFIIPIAIATAMLAGVLLGAPTLRLRGDYLAIVTLGFGEIIEELANNMTSVTGGPAGVIGIPQFRFNVLGIKYQWTLSYLPYYYLLLVFVVLALIAFHSLENSRVGRAWTAIREDEVAAESNGINVLKYKVMAFAIGASTSGFAGVLTASEIQSIVPTDFLYTTSILVLVLVIFGGMGSLPGAMIGAAILQWLPQLLSLHAQAIGYQQQDQYMYLGALLILMMIFRPAGLVPSRRRRREIGLAEQGVGSADAMSATMGPPS